MPKCHMAKARQTSLQRRPCGIIPVTALWRLCRYRHKTHSSGHKSRLDRDFSGRFGTEAYAFEELIAELGSAFLNADLGILGATLPDHADYLTNWIAILKGDKKAITTAAAQASKAHGFIKGLLTGQEGAEHQDAA